MEKTRYLYTHAHKDELIKQIFWEKGRSIPMALFRVCSCILYWELKKRSTETQDTYNLTPYFNTWLCFQREKKPFGHALHPNKRTHANTRVHMQTHTYTCTPTSIHMRTHACIQTCSYTLTGRHFLQTQSPKRNPRITSLAWPRTRIHIGRYGVYPCRTGAGDLGQSLSPYFPHCHPGV